MLVSDYRYRRLPGIMTMTQSQKQRSEWVIGLDGLDFVWLEQIDNGTECGQRFNAMKCCLNKEYQEGRLEVAKPGFNKPRSW